MQGIGLVVARADEAVLPVEPPLGRGGRHARRFGSVGRLHRQHAAPGQVLGVAERVVAGGGLRGHRGRRAELGDRVGGTEEERVDAVGHRHQRHDLARLGALEQRREQKGGVGRTGEAEVLGERVGHVDTCGAEPLRQPRRGAGVRAGDRDARHLRDVQAGVLEPLLPRRGREVGVALLAEALLPAAGPQVARGAPAVEELPGGGGAAEVLGEQAVGLAVADQQRGTGVAAVTFLRRAGGTGAHVAGDDEHGRVDGAQRRTQRRRGPPQPRAGIGREHVAVEAERRVCDRRVRLLDVGGRRGREPQRLRPRAGGRCECLTTCRDGHGQGVLVVGGDGAGTLRRSPAHDRGDAGAREPPVR